MEIADRISHLHYAIRDVILKAKEVEKTGKQIYYLNIGDPNKYDFQPPEHITNTIKNALDNPKFSGYAPSFGDEDLRQAVGRRENIDKENVFITNGLSEGISFLFNALVNPGDNVLLPSPGYPLYNSISKVIGAEDNYYSCDKDWNPDTEVMRKKVNKKTKAIVVINPNNPTGAVYSRKALEEIVNIAGEFDIPIIADEVYDKIVYDKEDKFISLADISKDVNVIRGYSISKVYFYPGARIGYLALHGEGLNPLKTALQKLCNARLCINWEMQRGALAAFTNPGVYMKYNMEKLDKRRDLLYNTLKDVPELDLVKPKGAFYAFAKINSGKWKDDWDFVYSLLEKTGVLVVPGSGFSPVLKEKYFRMVFLPQERIIQEATEKIRQFISE
ncbi:alanine aminotransferase [Candidatus Woesearchaeota archaeon]|nr:MAG: alanine aminotransferase [Candidatus Woesearchaeota archaeon]